MAVIDMHTLSAETVQVPQRRVQLPDPPVPPQRVRSANCGPGSATRRRSGC